MSDTLNIGFKTCEKFVNDIFGKNLHQKRQLSLANAALGLLQSGSAFLHKMGAGLAKANGLIKKHATKQIDRLLSNSGFNIWDVSESYVPYIIGQRKVIFVALDWSHFYQDSQITLSLNLITKHGRATPLLWKTIDETQLKHNRARYEDQMLSRFKEVLPESVIKVIVIADRGFADKKFFEFIETTLGFRYLIRIKSNTTITTTTEKEERSQAANDWLLKSGRMRVMKQVKLTRKESYLLPRFVAVKKKAMKGAWFLASNYRVSGQKLLWLYGKRWGIEPYFRDVKDNRYGFGLSQTHIGSSERRDRLFLVMNIAYILLTLFGAAGEKEGFDRYLKVNTVKTRTHSLITQGLYYYDYFPNFKPEQKEKLMSAFEQLLEELPTWKKFIFSC
jgi:hypothetical protein